MFRVFYSPIKMFVICFAFVILSLTFDGGVFRLVNLQNDHKTLTAQIVDLEQQNLALQRQIVQAQDPFFIERQAMDLYDLAGDQDLIFVFTDR